MGSRPKDSIQSVMDFNKDSRLIALEKEIVALRDRIEYLERLLLLSGHGLPAESTLGNDGRKMCVFCQELHSIQSCQYFKYLQVADRWSVAKKLGLCFRCLNNTPRHIGKGCPKTKSCGVKRCRLLHHPLLHDEEKRKFLRKLRAKRQVQLNDARPFEPSCIDSGIQNDTQNGDILTEFDGSGFIESTVTPAPSGGVNSSEVDEAHFLDSLDPFIVETGNPHAGTTTACDGVIDRHEIDELNRLAALAETSSEIPFDLIFSGRSYRNKSQSLRSENNSEMDSLDLFNNQSAIYEGQANAMDAPFSIENGSECPHVGTYVTCDGNMNSETDKMDSVTIENQEKSVDSQADSLDGPSYGQPEHDELSTEKSADTETDCENTDETIEPSNNEYGLVWPSGGEIDGHDRSEYSSPGTPPSDKNDNDLDRGYPVDSLDSFHGKSIDSTAEKFRNSFICTTASHGTVGKSNNNVQLRDLFQTFGASKSTLLLTLEDQLHRIDEEIASLSTPAKQIENKTEIDLSVWLMPDPGGSQKY